MSNLIEIQNQISKLQKQAMEIKAKEFDKTVREILSKMQAFGISVNDLRRGNKSAGKSVGKSASASASKRVKKPVSARPATVVAAKYRGPNGETWSGRGLMPRWLSALVTQGQVKESFLIKP